MSKEATGTGRNREVSKETTGMGRDRELGRDYRQTER